MPKSGREFTWRPLFPFRALQRQAPPLLALCPSCPSASLCLSVVRWSFLATAGSGWSSQLQPSTAGDGLVNMKFKGCTMKMAFCWHCSEEVVWRLKHLNPWASPPCALKMAFLWHCPDQVQWKECSLLRKLYLLVKGFPLYTGCTRLESANAIYIIYLSLFITNLPRQSLHDMVPRYDQANRWALQMVDRSNGIYRLVSLNLQLHQREFLVLIPISTLHRLSWPKVHQTTAWTHGCRSLLSLIECVMILVLALCTSGSRQCPCVPSLTALQLLGFRGFASVFVNYCLIKNAAFWFWVVHFLVRLRKFVLN